MNYDSNELSSTAALKATFAEIVGADHVRDDEISRRLFSEDIWDIAPHVAILIVAPGSTDELAQTIAAAHKAGVALAPRGAGMSYTHAYTPDTDNTVSLDLSRMNRILDINADNMTVTVEAGCTWLALNEALKAQGLRTPFWGPMSGIYSTIGGGLSQLNAMFGAGHYGTSSESVIALTMILGDGQILRTGARGSDGNSPFYRHFGPDLAGLFCGDCGTLGIKAEITLRLMRAPQHEDYASFSFGTGEKMLFALAEMARAGIAAETCGFDPGLTKVRMRRMSLMSDVKTLGKVISKEKSLGRGLLSAAKIALGGRNFIAEEDYSLHVICEGRSKEGVAHDLATAREIAAQFGGSEIENSIAKIVRASPFPPPNSMLGPDGESWAPVHGHVSLSDAPQMFADIKRMFADRAAEFERLGITTGYLFTSLSTNAITLEPVFFWPRGYRPVHASMVEPDHLARLPKLPENEEATAVVAAAREEVKAIAARYGCAHFQIGRTYPYRESRDDATQGLLDAIKGYVDPSKQFNPGVLGFPK